MKLTILGGANEIGANSYFLDLDGTGVLLDAGIHPKRQGEQSLPLFERIDGEVEEILISHAHLDHVGALPVALKRFPRARVFMTGPTSLLALRMLRNSLSVMRYHSPAAIKPLFDADQLEWVEQVLRVQELDQPFSLGHVAGAQPRVTFYNAGHLLGAVGLLIEHKGRRLFYSGDTCANRQYFCGAASYPRPGLDLLLLDSTHGADPQPQLNADHRRFASSTVALSRFVREVTAGGGSVLLPAFALGRTQELLGVLQHLMQQQRIPRLPIYISGLAHAICRIYDTTRLDSKRRHPGLRFEQVGYRLLDRQSCQDPALLNQPALFLVTSGMMFPDTVSSLLARRILPEAKHGLAFIGYLDPETPGYRVTQTAAGQQVDLGGKAGKVPLNCKVVKLGFTAHSRASQLVDTALRLQPRRVVLVHGDAPAVAALAQRLRDQQLEVEIATPGTTYEV